MAQIGFVVPWDRVTDTVADGAGQAIEEGGGALLADGFGMMAANATSLAFNASLGVLGGAVLPGIVAGAGAAHLVTSANISRVIGYAEGRGRAARRFTSMAAAVMDSKGNVDLRKMDDLKNMKKADLDAALGEKSRLRRPMGDRFLSGIERISCFFKTRLGNVSEEDALKSMPATQRLMKIDKANDDIARDNDAKRIETIKKMGNLVGNSGTEGALNALAKFAESAEFQSIAYRVLDIATSEKMGQAAHFVAKNGAKGAVEGGLEAYKENKEDVKSLVGDTAKNATKNVVDSGLDTIKDRKKDVQDLVSDTTKNVAKGIGDATDETGKVIENVLNGALGAKLEPEGEGKKPVKALPAAAHGTANGLYQGITDGFLAASSLAGSTATLGLYGASLAAQHSGWENTATGLGIASAGAALGSTIPLSLFTMSAPSILKRLKNGDAPEWEMARNLLEFLAPPGTLMLKGADSVKQLPKEIKKIPEEVKSAGNLTRGLAGAASLATAAAARFIPSLSSLPMSVATGILSGVAAIKLAKHLENRPATE